MATPAAWAAAGSGRSRRLRARRQVGFRPLFGANGKLGKQALAVLKPGQWSDLLSRLRKVENPVVPTKPSKYAITVPKPKRASRAHQGD